MNPSTEIFLFRTTPVVNHYAAYGISSFFDRVSIETCIHLMLNISSFWCLKGLTELLSALAPLLQFLSQQLCNGRLCVNISIVEHQSGVNASSSFFGRWFESHLCCIVPCILASSIQKKSFMGNRYSFGGSVRHGTTVTGDVRVALFDFRSPEVRHYQSHVL